MLWSILSTVPDKVEAKNLLSESLMAEDIVHAGPVHFSEKYRRSDMVDFHKQKPDVESYVRNKTIAQICYRRKVKLNIVFSQLKS